MFVCSPRNHIVPCCTHTLLSIQMSYEGRNRGRAPKKTVGARSPDANLLIIPVGTELTIRADLHGPLIEAHLPRFFDNLRNLPKFTDIYLRMDKCNTQMQFIGPNGQVCMVGISPRDNPIRLVLESLALIDTSKTKRLKIYHGNSPFSDLPY
jgi:hypothetical protein